MYNLAYSFVLKVYELTSKFPAEEEHNIKSQLRRAAVSVPLNIAEGSAKASAREFLHYLNTAYGSAKEIEVLLSLGLDLGYFSKENFVFLSKFSTELNAKFFLFIRNIETKIPDQKTHFFRKFKE